MTHTYNWTDTSIGGFAQCMECHIVVPSIKESECLNYVEPATREAERKAKRAKERETKRLATIAYLNKNAQTS